MGDICGTYFARDGSLVPLEMNGRSIAIGAEALKRVPTCIGVSSGPEKPLGNIGAARSSLVDVLITDEATAGRMLDILNDEATTNSRANGEPRSKARDR